MIKRDKTTRNLEAETRDVVRICTECPFTKCIEDGFKGTGKPRCGRYLEEYAKLQIKYGHKRLGHNA